MSENEKAERDQSEPEGEGGEENKGGMPRGIRQGMEFLSAIKDALEETIAEARERGDLSQERAREIVRGAVDRARETAGAARERFDFVTREEFEALSSRVDELAQRMGGEGAGEASAQGTSGKKG